MTDKTTDQLKQDCMDTIHKMEAACDGFINLIHTLHEQFELYDSVSSSYQKNQKELTNEINL